MKKQIVCFSPFLFFLCNNSYSLNVDKSAQFEQPAKLFRSQEILPVKLNYSRKKLQVS